MQQAIQSRQDPHRLLRLREIAFPERRRHQPLVNVAAEGQHRRTRRRGRVLRAELAVTGHVQMRQVLRDAHEPGQVPGRDGAHDVDQLHRLLQQPRCGVLGGGQRGIEV